MNRTVRLVLIALIITSFGGICALVDRDHFSARAAHLGALAAARGAAANATNGTDATSPARDPAGAAPTDISPPVTTITFATPNAPLARPNPANAPTTGTGKPASFWQLTVAYPTNCAPGSSVQPVLSWNAADTESVAVSVDSPTAVGGYGFYESIGTLTMPSIACAGTKGDPLPSHEYEIDAFGTDHTRLHIVLKVNVTVSPNLNSPTVPLQITAALPIAKQAV